MKAFLILSLTAILASCVQEVKILNNLGLADKDKGSCKIYFSYFDSAAADFYTLPVSSCKETHHFYYKHSEGHCFRITCLSRLEQKGFVYIETDISTEKKWCPSEKNCKPTKGSTTVIHCQKKDGGSGPA